LSFASSRLGALALLVSIAACGRVELSPLVRLDAPPPDDDATGPVAGDIPILALTLGCPTRLAPPSTRGAAESTWSDVEVDAAYRNGLAAWRTVGRRGRACTSCHSPDAIDLALLGYPDATLREEGAKDLEGATLDAVVKLVHAQRRRFPLARTCSPDWRPFQPTGAVLPGATARERDASFARELAQRTPLLYAGRVATGADARAALRELQAVDLRTLPIGIALCACQPPTSRKSRIDSLA